MLQKQRYLFVAVLIAITAPPAFSQEGALTGRNEIGVQAFGSFLKSTSNNGVDQSATNSGGVLASYRFFFNNYTGAEVNYGYSQNTQNYGSSGGSTGIQSHSHELSAAYVLRLPHKRWKPFVLAGAGALLFDPQNVSGAGSQARATFVYGGGIDVPLKYRLFLRAEYRGLVYSSPTFDLPGLAGTNRITHRAEPSIGFEYRF